MSSESVDDILEWFDQLQLLKRKQSFLKNVPASIADCVLVADIIHAVFPKIIQLHNYSETNSIQGRKMNWTLLNKKVLRLIHCEVTEVDIDSFSSRRSASLAIDFLRLLKVRLLAYEPLYLAGQYSVDPASQARLTAQLSSTQTTRSPSINTNDLPPPPPPNSSSRKQSMSLTSSHSVSTAPPFSTTSLSSTSSSSTPSEPIRRPSMMKSQQILKNRQTTQQKASRRASTMSANQMDLLYQEYSTKLRKSTQELVKDSDEKDKYSALMDARMAALRQQNKEELQKIDKKLTQSKQELAEIEQGKEIIGVDESILDHLSLDQTKSTTLKSQLNKQYHRASVVIGTSDSFWYQKDDHNYIHSHSSSLSPSTSPSPSPSSTSRLEEKSMHTGRRKSELSPNTKSILKSSNSHNHSSNAMTTPSSSSVESLTPSSPSTPLSPPQTHSSPSSRSAYSTPHQPPLRKSSKLLFESVPEDDSEGMSQPREYPEEQDSEDEDDEEDGETYHDISPLTYQSNMRGLEKTATPQRLSFQLETTTEETHGDNDENEDEDEDIDDDDSEDSYVPPPPPRAQQAQQRVDYIRGYSEEHGRFFYIKLNHDNDNDNGNTTNPNQGQSQWEAPTEGIVQCRDESTGRDYFTQVATGKSAWILSQLFE